MLQARQDTGVVYPRHLGGHPAICTDVEVAPG
jgi:hypothetical protein